MSSSELSVKVTMKSGSIASGMMTGTMGTTVGGRGGGGEGGRKRYLLSYNSMTHDAPLKLTPADKRDTNDESGGDLYKNNDQFLEHQHCLCPHPHH